MQTPYFSLVKNLLVDSEYFILTESEEEGILVVNQKDTGIRNLVLFVADPILIMEQYIADIGRPSAELYASLLQKNREMVHGAFVLDDSAKRLIYRDTLELEHLDRNELEASLNSLKLLLAEFSSKLFTISNN